MPSPARLGIRSRLRARSIARPNSECRTPEKPARCLERAPNRRRCKRRRLCKHFAASARRRSSRSSLSWANDLLHERLETRVAVQWLEQWIHFDPADIGAVAFLEAFFEPAQRLIVIVQAEIKQSAQVANHLALRDWKPDRGQHDHQSHDPIRNLQERENLRSNLNQKPADDGVSDRN